MEEEVASPSQAQFDDWQVTVLGGLVRLIQLNRQQLLDAKSPDALPYVAWLARNLLELLIWTEYCCTSIDNAVRFYEDSMRDMYQWLGLVKNLWEFHNLNTSPIAELAQQILNCAELQYVDIETQRFLQVRKAAAELDKADWFRFMFGILSTFAHPTAMSVIMFGHPILEDRKNIWKV